eukprot:13591943-Ditylum_brightwellii.AAC.1
MKAWKQNFISNNTTVTMEQVDKCISCLEKLEQPVSILKGIGPKTSDALQRMNLHTIRSLLWHFPTSFIDRTKLLKDVSNMDNWKDGDICTLIVTLQSTWTTRTGDGRKTILNASCRDEKGNSIKVVFFGGARAGKSLGQPGSKC